MTPANTTAAPAATSRIPGCARRTRRPLAVVVSRFPLITETFILREIEELERQGQPVVLVPLIRERGRVVHREAARWVDRMLYEPFVSPRVIAANVRLLMRDPRRYFGTLWNALAGAAHSFNVLLRTLALFPKTVSLAERLTGMGIGHVHAHFATYPAGAALAISQLGGPSYSFTAHAHDIFVPWRRASLRRKLEGARFVRAIAASGRDRLLSCCGAGTASKIHVIHVGVRPEDYAHAAPPGASKVPRLLCVAALKPYKGLAVLLDACQRLKEGGRPFNCDIVGDGPLRADIERLRAAMGLQNVVTLRGALRQDEVSALVARCDIALAPSIVAPDGQMDGIPVSLMEAMAAGRAVVASRLSGVPELVDDGVTGVLVEPGNAGELAAGIGRLLDDPALSARMGRRGRDKIQREFTLAGTVGALLARIDADNPRFERAEELPWCRAADALVPGTAIGVRRIHRRPDSTVVELLGAGGVSGIDYVLKVHSARRGDSRSAEERAEHEFLVLRRLQEMGNARRSATQGVRYIAPRVLGVSGAALLMEPCEGEPLVDLVRRARLGGPRPRAALVDALGQTGRWLRTFQRHTQGGTEGRTRLDALVERTYRTLGACETAGVIAARDRSRIEGHLAALTPIVSSSIAARPIAVGHHGDFWPGNVFVGPGAIAVIDFEGFRQGLPYEDIAYFLVQLELFFAYLPFQRFRRELCEAFLSGYCGSDAPDGTAYRWCRLVKAVQILADDPRVEVERAAALRRRRRELVRIALRGQA